MEIEKVVKTLCESSGVSGGENIAASALMSVLEPLADEVYQNALGSVVAVKRCGRKDAKKVMIDAHIDEIGLMVTDIDERGFLSFTTIGGVDKKTLLASVVTVHGRNRDVKGVIGAVPPHLLKDGEGNRLDLDKFAIDTGLSAEELRNFVEIGDFVTFDSETIQMGDCMSGKCMDDRACVAAMVYCLYELRNVTLNVDLYIVGATQEEVGCHGAMCAAYEINPDMAVAMDVCHATTPDNSENAFEMGKGVVLTKGPNIHRGVAAALEKAAKDYHINYQIEICGGHTGTDAWVIQVARCGIPTGLLSLPIRYMHSTVETLRTADITDTGRLLAFLLKGLSADLKEVFSC